MGEFVVYDTSTGRIKTYGGCTNGQETAQAVAGESVALGSGGDLTHYVSGGAITPKTSGTATIDKTTMTADGVDVATISGIIAPAIAWVGNDAYDISDTSLELTFDTPGTYTVRLDQIPHMLQEFVIDAT